MASFHDFQVKKLDGSDLNLKDLKGKVVLTTNVACQCGLTSSNYRELVELYNTYHDKGLEVIAWPCNQFGRQEPGSPEQIQAFVSGKGGDGIILTEKIDVNGPNTHPTWKYLKEASGDTSAVGWNFGAKFLIDKDGQVVARNGDSPKASEATIKKLLGV